MLAELYVEDFALIESLQVDFYRGLNVISGETGAGKSLLTDAVGLLMGNRADKDFIRFGSARALVEGTFTGPFSAAFLALLAEYGLEAADDTLVVTREVNAEGKNLCRINGRRVGLNVLNTLIPLLMNLHSQREHFTFLKEEQQIQILDSFGGTTIKAAQERVALAHSRWQEASANVARLKEKNEKIVEKQDYLQYRIAEIEALNLLPHEDEELRQNITLLKSGTQRLEKAATLCQHLATARDYLYEATRAMKDLAALDTSLTPEAEALTESYYTLEDLQSTIASYRDRIEADPDGLDEAEQRLSEIEKLKKKENTDLNGVLERFYEMKDELNSLEDFDYSLQKLAKEETETAKILTEQALELRRLRLEAGAELSKRIVGELHDLCLTAAQFEVDIATVPLHEKGMDKVTFMISMNRGEILKSLARVASGGEISRILLALKIIFGSVDQVQTMIFDEIDSGMSGKTMSAVSDKIGLLAKDMQVFVVTHSPIMAAKAHHHYYIEKVQTGGRTQVKLSRLQGVEIKREIARMVSGNEESQTSLAQAEELMAKDQVLF